MALKVVKQLAVTEDLALGLGTVEQIRDIGSGPETIVYNLINAGVIPTLDGYIQGDLDNRYTKEEANGNFAALSGHTDVIFKVADPVEDDDATTKLYVDQELTTKIASYAKITDVLTKTNIISYTPTTDYHPVTKKYIDDVMAAIGAGDMSKAIYDSQDNGIVNEARLLGGIDAENTMQYKGAVTDCDTVITEGMWDGLDITNAPAAGKAVLQVHKGTTQGIVQQSIHTLSDGKFHTRFYEGSTWTAWVTPQSGIYIVDDLNGDDSEDAALSANQGKVLAENITALSTSSTNVPVGGIIMYDGLESNIPIAWHLCNGNNGTPDLRDKFVRCAYDGDAVGDTGGSDNAPLRAHTHTGPSHTHTGPSHTHTGPSHYHSIAHNHASYTTSSNGAHTHNLEMKLHSTVGDNLHSPSSTGSAGGGYLTTDGAHTHTFDVPYFTGNSGNAGTGATGSSGTGTTSSSGTGDTGSASYGGDNKPAYYSLAYIKRIA